MSILDRFIARQFLTNVVILLALLGAFVVAIDASLNMDEFVGAARSLAAAQGQEATPVRIGTVAVLLVVDIWWPRLLQLFNYLLGIVLVGAMGFTLAQMSRHRELVAILASGQSLFRVARPILLVAAGLTVVQAINGEFILPRIAPLLARERPEAATRAMAPTRIPLAADGHGQVFYAEQFNGATGQLSDVTIWALDEKGLPLSRVRANQASWRDGGWQLAEGRVSRVTREGLEAEAPIQRVESDLDPTQMMMMRYKGFSQSMSFAQADRLLTSLNNLDVRQERRLERIKWGRVPAMLANVLALVVTIPFFLHREPRSMLVQSLRAAPVGLGSIMMGVMGSAAGIPGIPAALGVFLPMVVLTPLAIGMLVKLGEQT